MKIVQRIRSTAGKVTTRTVHDQAGGAEFFVHLDDGRVVWVDVTIHANGNVWLTAVDHLANTTIMNDRVLEVSR